VERRGRGIGCMWYPIGFTVSANPSSATVKVNEDGTVTLLTGTVETGQGALTVLAQIAAEALGVATEDAHVVSGDTDVTPMDTGATGEVEVIRIVAAHDCGRAINPMLVEGQVHGGIAMGLGFALQEEMLFDACGEQINPNLTNYIVPTSLDMPDIDVIIVETPDPTGPFNAKGVGEPTSVPTAAAVLNAIHDAVGVRLTSLPATAERILAALQERKGSNRVEAAQPASLQSF
jgi:CO/xanthine dehydrogenase Mo-binding subunit